MHAVKYQASRLRKIWLFATFFVALGAFFVGSLATNQASAATSKPYSNESPPTDIFSKGGTIKWLYYGNIRIENNKKGENKKIWDYALNPATNRYELAAAGFCEEDSEKPNDYLIVQGSGSVARFVTLAPEGSQSLSCDRKSQTIASPAKRERANALFYQIEGEKNTIKMWNTEGGGGTGISFRKTPAASGWREVYKRVDDPSAKCSDMLALKDDGRTWVFMPMIEWTDGVQDDYGFIDAAKSEAAASILGSHTLNECRTAAFEVVSVFKTGIKENDNLGPATDYKVNLSEKDGADEPFQMCGDEPGDYDGYYKKVLSPPEYSNVLDKVNKLQVKDGNGTITDVHEDDGSDHHTLYEVDVNWDGSAPSDDYNWLTSCRRTDNPKGDGNWAYHTLKVWETRAYGMTDSSNNRLIDMSHVKLYSYAYDGQDTNDDGYKADGGVAKIDASEVSGAEPNIDTDPLEDPDDGGAGDESTTCAIDKIGWIICPVLEKTADAADKAFEFLSKGFLQTDAELVETGGGTYEAWKIMRDFANAVFVVVFLIILYSQMTGAGISNYGVKKMLPKLIAGAILVNISFFICQIAVDLSNVLGWSLKGMLSGIADSINVSSGDNSAIATGSGGLGLAGIALVVLAAGAIVFLMLPILGGVILTAIIVLVTIIIILLLRKALIILLIFVSPLAFVAYLLPNTESLFNKWKDMFIKLLMVFPIVALLFGAGELASRVILAAGNGADYQSTDASAASATLGLVAAGVAVAPLLAVWGVLQGALAAAGAIGGRIRGATDKGGGFLGGKAGDAYKNTALGRGRALRKSGKEAYRNEKFADAVNDPKTGWQRMRSRAARGVSPITSKKLRGSERGLEHLDTAAFAAANKHDTEEVSNMADRLSSAASAHPISDGGANAYLRDQMTEAIREKDNVKMRAAMTALKSREGGTKTIQQTLAEASKDEKLKGAFTDNGFMQNVQSHVAANRGTYDAKDGRISQFLTQGGSIDNLNVNRLTQEQLGSQDGNALTASNITVEQASAVLQNKDVIGSAKQGTIDALKAKGGTP